jgi:2-dehydropantoate 2-reductase
MKIAVVGGAGAMGGVWASRLAAAGQDVTIVDVAEEAIAVINRNGLMVVETVDGPTVHHIPATNEPGKLGVYDAVIFFTKAHHTRSAAELIRPVIGPETSVVTLQNGWGNADTLAGMFDPARLVMGVTYLGATVTAPGRIAFTLTQGATFLGPYLPEASLDLAQAIGDAMTAGGIVTTVTSDVRTEIWKKLILNSAGLPVSALTRLTSGALGANEAALQICDALTFEAVAVARAKGLAIDAVERIATLRGLLARAGSGKASMLQDVEAKRKTEVEVINGAIVREADVHGIPVPLHRTMLALVQALESSWSP